MKMKLGSIRELLGMKPVLKDPDATGQDPVYWVFSECSQEGWANVTVIAPGNYGGEYPKTFGHYHGSEIDETYHLVEGEGVLVMQKKHFDESGKWIPEVVDEVVLIKAKPGDEILITPEWGHSWSNVGSAPLISFDDWRAGHSPTDYSEIEKLQGLAYYLIDKDGEVTPVANSKYQNLPDPVWMSAEEFRNRG